MTNKEPLNTRQIIETQYPEFPETILHAELCRACARVDGRSIKQSLKSFALARINSATRCGIWLPVREILAVMPTS